MMIETTLPTKTQFYVFLAVVELSPEKAQVYYRTPFKQAPDLYDSGVKSFLVRKAVELFNIQREQASTLYDTYLRSTESKPIRTPAITTLEEVQRRCTQCQSATTYVNGKGSPQWHKDDTGGFLCHRCYMKDYHNKQEEKKKETTTKQKSKGKSCQKCGSKKTYVYKYPRWHKNPVGKGLLCHACYSSRHYELRQKVK